MQTLWMCCHVFHLTNELVLVGTVPKQSSVSPVMKSPGPERAPFSSCKLKPAASYMRRNAPTFLCVKLQEKNVLFLLSTCAALINCGQFPKLRKINSWFWHSVSGALTLTVSTNGQKKKGLNLCPSDFYDVSESLASLQLLCREQ